RITGTPVSFQRFTRRPHGMVGGFPQTSIWRARGPRTGVANVHLVGDSVFPGQSTAGVTLSGLRVARQVHESG
ncbi:MAG: FAD-dependent oxidoreductase, partial [Myxococcales bacterium]|nr:FAD-dependent oxidoreductase [Myxococcales bacterium]